MQGFSPGDSLTWVINENYREANKPDFDTIQLKGGGDAPSAARAVLQTGDYDFAWNLQVEWSVLNQLKSSGGKGDLVITPGSGCERVIVNFTDPNKDVEGERSSIRAPHPFQTDPKVRQAYALLVDRDTINWGGVNVARHSNPTMDDLWSKSAIELDGDKRNQMFIQMNDLAVSDVVEIGVAARTGAVAKTKTLKWSANSPWDSNLWDTANWSRA